MQRWFGTQADSDRQTADRNSRAARRTIAQQPTIPSDSSGDEYNDCDTSLIFGVDGADDVDDSSAEMAVTAQQAAAELARQRALPIEDSDFDNDPASWEKELKLKFDAHDVEYWFNQTESQMKKYGINRQWDKKDAIIPMLPAEIVEEVKPLLRLTQADAGEHIYKDVKTEILQLYGSRDEDTFKKAIALRMTGKPSAFGKKLLHIICPGTKPLVSCHCARIVYGFWEAQLSAPIKTVLTGQKFTAQTYQELFKLADGAWLANGGQTSAPAVVAAVSSAPADSIPPTVDAPQVAAVNQRGRGRGRGQNRGRGRGRGNTYNSRGNTSSVNTSNNNTTSSTKPHQKGPKHPDLPAVAGWACAQHWKKGRGAPYCSDPLVCEWVQIVAPRT